MSGRENGACGAAQRAASCMAAAIVSVVVLLVAASALLFLLPATAPGPATPGGGGKHGPPREPVELAIGIAGHERWLDALRAWAKLACFKLRRPADDQRYDLRGSPASVAGAAKMSLEMGKETVEHAAESAARATEEAIERVKRKVSGSRSTSARRADGDL
ncbi:hypothetical protein BS78_02G359200 [Paspalum vaginatum]|nr:hypothetical protein BS78_02G359200 [Paspalum vaginatum]